jgi:transformation/transcription domain-associated protein
LETDIIIGTCTTSLAFFVFNSVFMVFIFLVFMILFNYFQDIAPDHTVKLDRVGADIPIVRRHGSSFRRLTLIGSDGSQRHFIVQTSLTPNARSDERILQLFRVMNQMFDKHKESRRRHICIHTPIIIPVWSQVIITAEFI